MSPSTDVILCSIHKYDTYIYDIQIYPYQYFTPIKISFFNIQLFLAPSEALVFILVYLDRVPAWQASGLGNLTKSITIFSRQLVQIFQILKYLKDPICSMGFKAIKYDILVCHFKFYISDGTFSCFLAFNWSPNSGQFGDKASRGPLDTIFSLEISPETWFTLFRRWGGLTKDIHDSYFLYHVDGGWINQCYMFKQAYITKVWNEIRVPRAYLCWLCWLSLNISKYGFKNMKHSKAKLIKSIWVENFPQWTD